MNVHPPSPRTTTGRPPSAIRALRIRALRISALLFGLVTAMCLLASACGGTTGGTTGGATGDTEANAGGKGGGKFTFTDDRGETVSLDKDPGQLRVVAQEDAANALAHLGIKPVGIFGGAPMKTNPMLKGVDLNGVESVGEVFGEVKMEKLAALRPDVIVSTFYTGDGVLFPGGVYGFQTKKMQDDAKQLAPILAIDSTKPSSHVIERFSAMAKAMGAETDGGKAKASKARWEKAVEELKKTAARREDLTVLAITPAQDQVYFAVPKLFPDLLDLQDWGVKLMKPTGKLVSSYYEAVSWENSAKYQPSVVLLDARGYTLGPDALKKYPTWDDMKAVRKKQVGSWVRVSLNYDDYTSQVEQLTALLEKATKV